MEMYAYKCKNCGHVHHPKYYLCQNCGAREFDELPLEGKCTILTWTRVHNLPAGFNEKWRNYGIVKFENGLTASALISFDDIEVGMEAVAKAGAVRITESGEEKAGFIIYKE